MHPHGAHTIMRLLPILWRMAVEDTSRWGRAWGAARLQANCADWCERICCEASIGMDSHRCWALGRASRASCMTALLRRLSFAVLRPESSDHGYILSFHFRGRNFLRSFLGRVGRALALGRWGWLRCSCFMILVCV